MISTNRPSPQSQRLKAGVDSRRGWLIVGILSVTVTVSYGVLTYAFGVVLIPMQRDLAASRLELTGAFSLALGVWAVAGVGVGVALDSFSPRILLAGGAALGALLVLAWSQVQNVLELYVVFAGLGIAMAMVLYNSVFAVATKWFDKRRREAITLISFAGAFASIIFSPLTGRLTAELGWRAALVILALVLAVVAVPLHCMVGGPQSGRRSETKALGGRRRFAALRSGQFWQLAAALALGGFCWSALVVQLVPLLVDEGKGIAFATFAAGIVGISQLPGRLSFAVFGRLLAGGRLPLVTFGLAVAGLLLLALARTDANVFSFAVLFGMSAGLLTLWSASAPAELFEREVYGTVSGALYACSNAARAAGPLGSAAIALLPGSYTTLLTALAALSAVAGVLGASAVRSSPYGQRGITNCPP